MTSKSCWRTGIGGKRRSLPILRPSRCTGDCNLCVILHRYMWLAVLCSNFWYTLYVFGKNACSSGSGDVTYVPNSMVHLNGIT